MYRLLIAITLILAVGCDKKETATTEVPNPIETEKVEKKIEPAAVVVKPTVPAESKALLQKPAPDFTLKDLDGKDVTLSSYKDKIVVLEWFNPECPYVKAAHNEGSLKTAAKDNADVVWLAINSNAEGNQGHGVELNTAAAKGFAMAHPVLMDPDGTVGRLYNAQRTPQMFVINKKGTLVYRGGLDTSGSGFPKDAKGKLRNHVQEAIDDLKKDGVVRVATTKTWGCSVKY